MIDIEKKTITCLVFQDEKIPASVHFKCHLQQETAASS